MNFKITACESAIHSTVYDPGVTIPLPDFFWGMGVEAARACVRTHMSAGARRGKLDLPAAGVISSCEPPNMAAWNQTQVLCESNMRSQPLGHLCSTTQTSSILKVCLLDFGAGYCY